MIIMVQWVMSKRCPRVFIPLSTKARRRKWHKVRVVEILMFCLVVHAASKVEDVDEEQKVPLYSTVDKSKKKKAKGL